jgi:hypothetical protein
LGAGAIFYCTARAGSNGAGQFTVPPPVLLSLPVSAVAQSPTPSGFLGIASQTASEFGFARGIDVGFALGSVEIMRNVNYLQ